MKESKDTIEKLFSRLNKQEENEVLRYAYLIDDLKGAREEIERLNNIINNPEDLTLCKMWADTKLKEKNEELMSLYTSERYVKEDYKSIINKAIEYIKQNKVSITTLYAGTGILNTKDDLLNILQGVDKE